MTHVSHGVAKARRARCSRPRHFGGLWPPFRGSGLRPLPYPRRGLTPAPRAASQTLPRLGGASLSCVCSRAASGVASGRPAPSAAGRPMALVSRVGLPPTPLLYAALAVPWPARAAQTTSFFAQPVLRHWRARRPRIRGTAAPQRLPPCCPLHSIHCVKAKQARPPGAALTHRIAATSRPQPWPRSD